MTSLRLRSRSFPHRAAAVACLAVLVGPAACSSDEPPDNGGEDSPSIAEVREEADGATVTVEGNVSVAPGAFHSAMGDQGFALQDATAGLYVKLEELLDFDVGQRVRVTGTLGQQAQLRVLSALASDVTELDGGEEPTPRSISTGAVAETVEGLLIEVEGTVTQTFVDDSPYGYKFYVDDGSGEVQIFVHIQADTDPAPLQALVVGDVVGVIGFAAQYETTYEVAPRGPGDIILPPAR